jgi:hypothetical protein
MDTAPKIHRSPDTGDKGGGNQLENISEVSEKVREKYLTKKMGQFDASQIGDIKLIEGNIFFVYQNIHATKLGTLKKDQIIVLDKDMKEVFKFDKVDNHEYTNHTDHTNIGTTFFVPQSFTKPENEIKEIVGIKNNMLAYLNGKDQEVRIHLPENILNKKE